MNTAASTNLQNYILYTNKLSKWQQYETEDFIIALNADNSSVFNYVFSRDSKIKWRPEELNRVLELLNTHNKSATWVVDRVNFPIAQQNLEMASSPIQAEFALKNYRPSARITIELKVVANPQDLEEYDCLASSIFHTDFGIITMFFRGLLTHPTSILQLFLIKYKNSSVGTCAIYAENSVAGFYIDGVLPEFRNLGIATAAIAKRIEIAKQLKCTLAIAQCMPASQNLYKRFGFQMKGGLPLYISSPVTPEKSIR